MCNSLLQYSVSESELSSRTLWLSVWDWDRLGRNQFLGEMRVPLQSFDLQDEAEIWYPLVDKVNYASSVISQYTLLYSQ